ncbi:MAG: hypothetical protein NTY32_01030 [Bacteroidia bacterium]|nr:hypothetical protein [Bacteroidia bacterium]
MKLAVTDACIFIDIIELDLTKSFFELQIEIHTTIDVFNELYPEQQASLEKFIKSGVFTLHNLGQTDRIAIQNIVFPRSLSENDKTVIFLAKQLNAKLLSSDKIVRNFAKSQSIDYHGMLWIFDQLISQGIISKQMGLEKIHQLMTNNVVYQNNMELILEIELRLKIWSKS